MTDNAESYELSSGLVDDFDCEILDAWFATDGRYNNGQTTLLFWKASTDDTDHPMLDEGEAIRFATGADWESLDGGKTVEHPSGKTKFNNQSAIGTLIARAVELGAGPALMARGPAQHAEVWVGLKFHMKRETYTSKFQGKEEQRERLLPVEFLGSSGENGAPAAAAPSAPAKASMLDDLDPALRETLKGLKANSASHGTFVDAAMELTEVTANTTLVMALATPDGLYAEL